MAAIGLRARRTARIEGGVWSNWAGNQACAPAEIAHPAGTEELVGLVKSAEAAGRPVKVVGAGHSFTDIATTAGTLVVLDRHQRLLDVDRERCRVTVQSGIPLSVLNQTLAVYGMAMPNLGDIEYQSIAGATQTGTHGTGERLGCLSTQIVGIDLVTADGSVRSLSAPAERGEDAEGSEGAEAFACARVGLGALGIVDTVTLQCVPAFNLSAVEGPMLLDEVIEGFDALTAENDHFEFYWMPHSRWAIVKRNNRTTEPEARRPAWKEFYDDVVFQNWMFGLLGMVQRRRPQWVRPINRALPKPGLVTYVDRSDRVFTSPRLVRFCETEYGFPREHAVDVIRAVRAHLEGSELQIGFPIECRVTAGDDIPLSMASGRASCFIACHVFRGQPYEQYFRGIESIMNTVEGRPHWGKLHFQRADTLAPRYPQWKRFAAVRRRLDPEGRFTNAYLERVLGPG